MTPVRSRAVKQVQGVVQRVTIAAPLDDYNALALGRTRGGFWLLGTVNESPRQIGGHQP
ncbi:protein of unknown function [Candidatus Bipolaricaulis anaerobius]|uniref:Uncharacterized protein n=1 Tax=Candidatus Bipolaricaulis anaerobius TaxID=2026885 RepID=A0A2X3L074_9BACT|nr:protein of unknown function [Candidatus Bipolaricaulis anaerobius]